MAKPVSLQAETHPVLASSRARNLLKNENDDMFGLTPNYSQIRHFNSGPKSGYDHVSGNAWPSRSVCKLKRIRFLHLPGQETS
jgi:hypothetical protein